MIQSWKSDHCACIFCLQWSRLDQRIWYWTSYSFCLFSMKYFLNVSVLNRSSAACRSSQYVAKSSLFMYSFSFVIQYASPAPQFSILTVVLGRLQIYGACMTWQFHWPKRSTPHRNCDVFCSHFPNLPLLHFWIALPVDVQYLVWFCRVKSHYQRSWNTVTSFSR